MGISWNRALNRGLLSGTSASILSTVALLLFGRRESRSALAPVNAVSHWYWGDDAIRRNQASLKYTVPGYLTHHAMSVLWAVLFERVFGRIAERSTMGTIGASATTAAVACFVDYQLTPKRLTPGFEHRLSKTALFVVYSAFAAGLALTEIARAATRRRRLNRTYVVSVASRRRPARASQSPRKRSAVLSPRKP